MIWFTADTHFWHKNILAYQKNRKFPDLAHMNAAIVREWQYSVRPEDTVYVLGDFNLGGKAQEIKMLIAELPGKKILVRGNHDHKKDQWYLNAGFEQVLHGYQDIQLSNGDFITVSHYPYRPGVFGTLWYAVTAWKMLRFFKKLRPNNGMFLAHGHVHDRWKRKGNMLNVGWDVHGQMVSEDRVYAAMRESAEEFVERI